MGKFLSTPSARRATAHVGVRHLISGFLSTPSARRATLPSGQKYFYLSISIHALREEGDSGMRRCPVRHPDFYPRPPRGGRRMQVRTPMQCIVFLSTPSARRATPTVTEP